MKTILKQFDCIEYDIPMKQFTAYKTGGPADILARPKNIEQLKDIIALFKQKGIDFMVLGNCTNVLVRDKGIRGAVILTTQLDHVQAEGNILTCGAGASMAKCAAGAQKHALSGMEAVSGIPGTMGGAVYMNAGSYGTAICDILLNSVYLDSDMNQVVLDKQEHEFGYRKSFYTDSEFIILQADIRLEFGDKQAIKQAMIEYGARRKASQPLDYPSCGSVFKRPVGHYAGKLIEDSGLKGYCVNGACVSPKHAGFIINKGDATSTDILRIMEHIRSIVYNNYKVVLEPEVKVIGEQ